MYRPLGVEERRVGSAYVRTHSQRQYLTRVDHRNRGRAFVRCATGSLEYVEDAVIGVLIEVADFLDIEVGPSSRC